MRGISLRALGVDSESGCFFLSSIFLVYTRAPANRELFEGFQRGLLGKFGLAAEAGHKVDCFPDGHSNTKIQRDPAVLTGPAGYLFEAIGNIRLGALVKLHVGVDRKAVATFHADSPPLTIRLHEASVNRKSIAFANGAMDRGESLFYFFGR